MAGHTNDVAVLLQALNDGDVSAVDTVRRWLEKSDNVNNKVNAIVQCVHPSNVANPMAAPALARAQQLDTYLPSEKGPLHGLPISIKECYLLEGTDATVGFLTKRGNMSTTTAALVKCATKLGAVPFCKTNVPTTMMSWDCWSGAYGQTFHPLSKEYGPGGSSGGEGALIASGGSMVGFGSDVGGSVRIPAAFSGCVGFKPSTHRLPNKGLSPVSEYSGGQHSIMSQAGVMGSSVGNITSVVKALLSPSSVAYMRTLDPTIIPLPWRDSDELLPTTRRKLRFGYYITDGLLEVAPACRRAVLDTVDKLRGAGYEVVEYDPIPGSRVSQAHIGCLMQTKPYFTNRNLVLGNEEVRGHLARLLLMAKLPKFIQNIVSWLVCWLSPTFKKFFAVTTAYSNLDLHYYRNMAKEVQTEHHDRMITADVDILLCPVNAEPAAKIGSLDRYYLMCMSYVSIFNITNSPAGTVPVTHVRPTDVEWLENDTKGDKMIDMMRSNYMSMVKDQIKFSVSVQLAGRLYNDEQVLEAMRIVEELSAV